jgi:hypothetical protein
MVRIVSVWGVIHLLGSTVTPALYRHLSDTANADVEALLAIKMFV